MSDLMTCTNLAFAYNGHTILEGINFAVEDGDYLCIVGENGAGKSTLIKGILGLKKKSSGSIDFSQVLTRKSIGYLPQSTDIQRNFPSSVWEVVLSGSLNAVGHLPFYTAKHKLAAKKNIERLGITDLTKKCFRDLSGGQQQRVLLARALCSAKKLLILDEPTAGLDPIMTSEMYSLIKKINDEMGITIMMVSHDINSAIKYAKHILHLNHGQLFFGTTEQYIESDVGKKFMKKEV